MRCASWKTASVLMMATGLTIACGGDDEEADASHGLAGFAGTAGTGTGAGVGAHQGLCLIIVRESEHATVQDIRIEGAWDGVRFSSNAPFFTLRGAWVSNWRDDAVENDQVRSGTIQDCLFDGGFVGISLDPGGGSGPSDSDSQLLVVDHYLQRLKSYPYRKQQTDPVQLTHGNLFKGTSYATRVVIRHSVFAVEVEPFASEARLGSVIDKLDGCENNYLLYFGDGPIPSQYKNPLDRANEAYPGCFQYRSGQEARDIWEHVKSNWIHCHPRVPRAPDAPASDCAKCDPLLIDRGL